MHVYAQSQTSSTPLQVFHKHLAAVTAILCADAVQCDASGDDPPAVDLAAAAAAAGDDDRDDAKKAVMGAMYNRAPRSSCDFL